jgi:hypothetical protein
MIGVICSRYFRSWPIAELLVAATKRNRRSVFRTTAELRLLGLPISAFHPLCTQQFFIASYDRALSWDDSAWRIPYCKYG